MFPKPAAIVVAVFAMASASGLAAQEAPVQAASAEQLARQLIQLTGGGNLGKEVMSRMIDAYRAADPDIPQAFWDEFMAQVEPGQIEDLAVPIYVKNLIVDEMAAAIAFYSSPPGQSLVRKLPAIMRESMAAGQAWGQKLARDVAERLAEYKRAHPKA
jgi:hypothetical protein